MKNRQTKVLLSSAKIARPGTGGILQRPRLFQILDRSLAKLIWISGPPGSGKTMLAASYAEQTERPSVWLRLEHGDSDPASFFLHFTEAAVAARIAGPDTLPKLALEQLPNLAGFLRPYCRALFRRQPKRLLIILDDVHEAQESPAISACLLELAQEIPPGATLLALSRQELPGHLLRSLVNQRVVEIDPADLSFTLEETKAILSRPPYGIEEKVAHQLYARTGGWAAGLVLYGTLLQRQVIEPSDLTGILPGRVRDYFTQEVIRTLDPADLHRLVHAAWFPYISPEIAATLTGSEELTRLLRRLSRRGLFVKEHRNADIQYRYHPLFQQMLQELSTQRQSADGLAELRRRSADLIEQAGDPAGAIEMRLDAQDFERAREAILATAPMLLAQARFTTMRRWIETLPPALLQRTPWLQYWMGMCAMFSNPGEALTWFDQAFTRFERSADLMGTASSCCGAMEAILLDWRDFRRLDRWIAAFDPLYPLWSRTVSPDLALRGAADMLGSLLWRRPHHRRIDDWVSLTTGLLDKAADPSLRSLGLSHILCFHLWKGDIGRAEQFAGVEAGRTETRTLSPMWSINRQMYHAVWCWHSGRYAECEEAVSRALALAAETGVHVGDHHVLSQGVYATLLDGKLDRADQYLKQFALALNPVNELMVGHFEHLTAWACWLKGDLSGACRHLDRGYRAALQAGSPFPIAANHYAKALLAHDRGQTQQASRHIARSLHIGKQMRSRMLESMGLLAQAFLALDRPDPPSAMPVAPQESDCRRRREALEQLRKGLAISRELNLTGHTWWNPRVMSRLCAVALEQAIEVPYVRQLIRRARLAPPESALHLFEWPWPVRIVTLGRFGIHCHGNPPACSGKAQRKPLELLKILVALGGRKVSDALVADTLWPEADGDAAYRALITTIHRLRKLVGEPQAIQHAEGMLTLNPRLCWVDAWVFEELERQARHDPAVAPRALALYQGPFLQHDVDAAWANGLRNRLRAGFLRAAREHGRQREQAGQWEEARDWYERALAVEPEAEELAHGLKRCLASLAIM